MKSVVLVAAVVISTFASFYVGTTYTQRRAVLDNNLCLTNKAIVTVLTDSLAQWTPKLVREFGRGAYEKARRRTFYYAVRFQEAAPCEIQFRLPPDFTKGG